MAECEKKIALTGESKHVVEIGVAMLLGHGSAVIRHLAEFKGALAAAAGQSQTTGAVAVLLDSVKHIRDFAQAMVKLEDACRHLKVEKQLHLAATTASTAAAVCKALQDSTASLMKNLVGQLEVAMKPMLDDSKSIITLVEKSDTVDAALGVKVLEVLGTQSAAKFRRVWRVVEMSRDTVALLARKLDAMVLAASVAVESGTTAASVAGQLVTGSNIDNSSGGALTPETAYAPLAAMAQADVAVLKQGASLQACAVVAQAVWAGKNKDQGGGVSNGTRCRPRVGALLPLD